MSSRDLSRSRGGKASPSSTKSIVVAGSAIENLLSKCMFVVLQSGPLGRGVRHEALCAR